MDIDILKEVEALRKEVREIEKEIDIKMEMLRRVVIWLVGIEDWEKGIQGIRDDSWKVEV